MGHSDSQSGVCVFVGDPAVNFYIPVSSVMFFLCIVGEYVYLDPQI